MIVIMKDWWRKYRKSSEGSLDSTQTIPHKRKKTEIGKAVCCFFGTEDYQDKLTAAGEYHSGSNCSNMQHVESLTEDWKQMVMQLWR